VNHIVSYLVLGLINVLYIDIICFLTLKKLHLKLQKKREKKISLKMPGVITVSDFVRETNEDIKSPTTSSFVHRIPQCKDTVTKLEEALAGDRDSLSKLKSSIKEMHKSGNRKYYYYL